MVKISNVKAKYAKDENNEIFSPITSAKSVITPQGGDLDPGLIMTSISGDPEFTFLKDWVKYYLPYNNQDDKVGDYFTLSGSTITINKDIKCIRISAQCVFWGDYNAPEVVLGILVTDSSGREMSNRQTDQHKTGGMLCNVVAPHILMNVKKGFKIQAYTVSGTVTATKVLGRNTHSFMLVEKVF